LNFAMAVYNALRNTYYFEDGAWATCEGGEDKNHR
jgi:hypothetical protein